MQQTFFHGSVISFHHPVGHLASSNPEVGGMKRKEKVKGVKRGWIKGVKGERGGFKVDKREELKVEKGKG